MPPTPRRTDDSVIMLSHDDVRPGWEQWYLLMSDAHWDNPHCERQLLKRHFDQAVERDAGIFSIGDWFCAMQGRGDKRASKDDLLPEHQGGNYLDKLVDTAAEWLEPYAANIMFLADGNHEQSIERLLETSLTQRLADKIGCERMYEWGFVRFQFANHQGAGRRTSKVLYFHHGAGGGGPVTKGVIQTNRANAAIEADIYASGHVHERWLVDTPKLSCSSSGKALIGDATHIQASAYKQEMVATGYHTRNRRPPKPLGGWWLRFHYDPRKPGRVGYETIKTD